MLIHHEVHDGVENEARALRQEVRGCLAAGHRQLEPVVAAAGEAGGRAYEKLAAVYGWFTEGFDSPDLQEAKALLRELVDGR